MKNNGTARLRRVGSRLSRLMRFGLLAGKPWTELELRSVLEFHLDAPLRLNEGPDSSETSGEATVSGPGNRQPEIPTIRALFWHERPPLDLLERVKFFGKTNAGVPDGDVPRDVALVFYYTAIAVARLRWGERISRLSDARLRECLDWMLDRTWLPPDLKALLTETREHLACSTSDSG